MWDLTLPPGRFMDDTNFKKIASYKISISSNFKNQRFFVNNVYKEKMFTIEIEDGREAP